MSAAEYLKTTPPEIIIKVEALKDSRRYEASRDYQNIVALLNGRNDPKQFPSFDRFYPDTETESETGEKKVERHVEKAMETARLLGDI